MIVISPKFDWSFSAFMDACADVNKRSAGQPKNRKRAAKKHRKQAALCGVAYAVHKSIVNIIRRS